MPNIRIRIFIEVPHEIYGPLIPHTLPVSVLSTIVHACEGTLY